MMFRRLVLFLALGTACVMADEGPSDTPSGKIMQLEFQRGSMLVSTAIPWERYTAIQLEQASVVFREGWKSDQQRLNNALVREVDLARIRSDMSEMLEEVLADNIERAGDFTLAEASGSNVLRLTPRISKLDILAPGRLQDIVGDVLVDGKGSMVLVMEISDSVSGELLASAWRLEVDPDKGFMETATEASNKTAFKRMMREWTDWFFSLLNHIRTRADQLS